MTNKDLHLFIETEQDRNRDSDLYNIYIYSQFSKNNSSVSNFRW